MHPHTTQEIFINDMFWERGVHEGDDEEEEEQEGYLLQVFILY